MKNAYKTFIVRFIISGSIFALLMAGFDWVQNESVGIGDSFLIWFFSDCVWHYLTGGPITEIIKRTSEKIKLQGLSRSCQDTSTIFKSAFSDLPGHW